MCIHIHIELHDPPLQSTPPTIPKSLSFVSFSTSRILKLQVPGPWASLNVIKRTPHRFGRTKVETAESIWPKFCHQPKNLVFFEIRGIAPSSATFWGEVV